MVYRVKSCERVRHITSDREYLRNNNKRQTGSALWIIFG